jgi:hypothetical protein
VLIATLPEASRLACPAGEYEPWTRHDELLTQLLEVNAVQASGQQFKKPPKFHRPKWLTGEDKVTDPETVDTSTTGPIRGHAAIMAKAKAQGHLRVVPDAS